MPTTLNVELQSIKPRGNKRRTKLYKFHTVHTNVPRPFWSPARPAMQALLPPTRPRQTKQNFHPKQKASYHPAVQIPREASSSPASSEARQTRTELGQPLNAHRRNTQMVWFSLGIRSNVKNQKTQSSADSRNEGSP